MAQAHGLEMDQDIRTRFLERLDRAMDETGPGEELVTILDSFRQKGVRMGLVTFQRRPRLERRLESWQLSGYFQSIITPEQQAEFKPSPQPFLAAIRELGVPSNQCCVIGDEPADMIGGKKAGATTIGLPQGFFFRRRTEGGRGRFHHPFHQRPLGNSGMTGDVQPTTSSEKSTGLSHLAGILSDKHLAQFGDSLLNFAYSIALTRAIGEPKGTKVQDRVLAEAAVRAGLRKSLPRRVGRGDVANSLEALLGHVWLEKSLSLEEIVSCLAKSSLNPADDFTRLAELALSRIKQ